MLNIFVSYSHKDEELVNHFVDHLSPLTREGKITIWNDRKLNTSELFNATINEKLDDSDVICLMISANYLASDACNNEKDRALKLKVSKGTKVVPIILSHCGWLNIRELSNLIAIPTDGKPIIAFTTNDEGFLDCVNWLNKLVNKFEIIKGLKCSEEFDKFLTSTDILSKSHFNKEIHCCPRK